MGKIKQTDSLLHLPSEPIFAHFKNKCVCCEKVGKEMNKEHFYPRWLLNRTNCEKDLLNSPYGKIPGYNLTVPLFKECNTQLGKELEVPVSIIFNNIESGQGFNDFEAELLIRWMWKINGTYYWSICNKNWRYGFCTLKKRVLSKIEQSRSRISIGIAIIKDAFEDYGSAPIGLDAFTLWSNVYTAGVFSRISIVVFLSDFKKYIDEKILDYIYIK